MRGIGGAGEAVEEGDVVLLWRSAKMLQRGLFEAVKVEGRGDKVIGDRQFIRAQWQPMFEP